MTRDGQKYSNKSIMNFVDSDVQQVINKLENARNQNQQKRIIISHLIQMNFTVSLKACVTLHSDSTNFRRIINFASALCIPANLVI